MIKKICFIAFGAACFMLASCTLFQSLADQIKGLANLANCEYSLKSVSHVAVAGVDVMKVAGGDISVADVAKLGLAITTKTVPVSMNLNVGIKNPTETQASLSAMDWAVNIQGTEVVNGATNRAYTVSPKKTSTVPLGISTDVYRLFSKDGVESLTTFAKSFNSDGTSSKVAIKIRPSLQVGSQVLKTPNYITIQKNIGKKATNTTTASASKPTTSSSKTGTTSKKKA